MNVMGIIFTNDATMGELTNKHLFVLACPIKQIGIIEIVVFEEWDGCFC